MYGDYTVLNFLFFLSCIKDEGASSIDAGFVIMTHLMLMVSMTLTLNQKRELHATQTPK